MSTPAQQRRANKFLAKNPYFVGEVAGVKFYEHPTLGDESPLVSIKDGVLKHTEFYELPRKCDLED